MSAKRIVIFLFLLLMLPALSLAAGTTSLSCAIVATDDVALRPLELNQRDVVSVLDLVYEGLFTLDESFTPQMVLCRSYTCSADGLTWRFTLRSGGACQVLPQKEFQLLYKLSSFPGQIFTRQQLMDDIWGVDSETDAHTVDVHIGRLRERLRDNPDLEIVTVRGLGYKAVRKND